MTLKLYHSYSSNLEDTQVTWVKNVFAPNLRTQLLTCRQF
jgi:hypothetical protein